MPSQSVKTTACANECVGVPSDHQDTQSVEKSHLNYKKLVGERVKALRVANTLTQEVLSERCGIFRTYLSRIESGSANPTLVVLVALAGALEVPPAVLFQK
jgi:DNA-binding XRE family transcriptional regulator